jgi:hypothetical protein
MAGFLFRLETADGVPAEPPTLSSAVPDWGEGDTIHLGVRTLRVVGKRRRRRPGARSDRGGDGLTVPVLRCSSAEIRLSRQGSDYGIWQKRALVGKTSANPGSPCRFPSHEHVARSRSC